MSASIFSATSTSLTSLTTPVTFNLKEVTEEEFAKNFEHASEIYRDEIEFSSDFSISSLDMTWNSTLFGLKKNQGEIEAIFAYQIGQNADELEIQDKLEGAGIKGRYDLYIIGGYVDSSDQMKNIHEAIRKFFGTKSQIVGELTNLNAKNRKLFVSANLQMNGELTICSHDCILKIGISHPFNSSRKSEF